MTPIDSIVVLGQVLLWLKQWDSRVFRSEICSTSEEVLSALKRHSTVVQNKKPVVSKFQRMSGGPKWSNDRYRHSKSMDEISTPKSFQDISNRKAKHTGPPEHKVIIGYHLFKLEGPEDFKCPLKIPCSTDH